MTLSGGEKTHCPLLCISVCEEGERNKQVSCAALSLSGLAPPPPPSQWEVLTPEGLLKAALLPAPLSVGKQKPVSCTQLLLIFFVALRSSVLRPPSSFFSFSLLLETSRIQDDAGGFHYGGVRRSCSRTTQ